LLKAIHALRTNSRAGAKREGEGEKKTSLKIEAHAAMRSFW
jgi:hypothetical protein